MKIDPYCQPTKCTFQRCIDCVDISRRSSARGRETTVKWQKQVFIDTQLSRAYLALGFRVISITKVILKLHLFHRCNKHLQRLAYKNF